MRIRRIAPLCLAVSLAGCGPGDPSGTAGSQSSDATPIVGAVKALPGGDAASAALQIQSQVAPMYAADFVGTAATGYAMNDAGDVVGTSYTDPGCGPFCLPPQENVVWRNGARIVLPLVPGAPLDYQYPRHINNQGLIAGVVGYPGSSTHAAAWIPDGAGYAAADLGTLPGMSSADVAGLDDQGRMVGWSTLGGAIPSAAAPFMWSQPTGMVNLAAQGYPNERPAAISQGGNVATWGTWYRLGDPASATPLPPPPRGFVGAGSNGSAINDSGDQAHFLVSTSTQNLVYPFRLAQGGDWQQISAIGTGHLSRSGMGSINAARDVTFTAGSTGFVAAGPDGIGQPLAALLSPAYGAATIGDAGRMNASGQILAQMMIGRSQRLVKLTPVTACTSDCLVSSALVMTGQFVEDRAFPGSCFEGGKMYNVSSATVTITDGAGVGLANVEVGGRFLDDYWTNHPVSGTTDAAGVVRWTYSGPCGVGAIAFLVERASLGAKRFDRTRGTLASYVIPGTAPPPANAPPVPVPLVTCSSGKVCAFDGTRSYDPDGTIAAYRWAAKNGTTLSTQSVFSQAFAKAGKNSIVLRVTDNGGLSASKTVSFTVIR